MEQQIKISARGEFGQLRRGLDDLKRDLDSVGKAVDKATSRGGMFGGEEELAALDLYKKRFLATMEEVDKEFAKQSRLVDELERRKEKAFGSERRRIREEIRQREQKLDLLRQELLYMERLYNRFNAEASSYSVKPSFDSDKLGDEVEKSFLGRVGKRILARGVGLGKGALALAGIGGVGAILAQAYQSAYSREVDSLDLAQRIRGFGFSGSATEIYDAMFAIGRSHGMGYTGPEVQQFADLYSRQAGALSQSDMAQLLMFSRGYGLELNETAQGVSSVVRMGGATTPTEFADMIAASVGKSGMTPRILEVMETNAILLDRINTTLKDGQSKQLLAYQTTLDRIGLENNMTKLTGTEGANVIAGLGGIFSPNNDQWLWMGIRALQAYNPQKYQGSSLYELMRAFEDGLNNPENLPAMSQYVKTISGGNTEVEKFILQRWLQQGGYNATKTQVDELYAVTNGLSVFSEDIINKLVQDLERGDAGSKYLEERRETEGQRILDVEAQYRKALEGLGSEFLGVLTNVKGGIADAMNALNIGLDQFTSTFDRWVDSFLNKLPESWGDKTVNALEFVGDNWEGFAAAGAGAWGISKWLRSRNSSGTGSGSGAGSTSGGGGDVPPKTPNSSSSPQPGGSNKSSKLSIGKSIGKVLGVASIPFVLSDLAEERKAREEMGDTRLGSLWKSSVDILSLGLVSPDYVTNQQRGFENQKQHVLDKIAWFNRMYSKADNSRFSNFVSQDLKNKTRASNVLDFLVKDYGLDLSTEIGTITASQALRRFTGASEADIPEELKKSLSSRGLSYNQVNLSEDQFWRNLLGNKTFQDAGDSEIGQEVKRFAEVGRSRLEGFYEEGTEILADMNASSGLFAKATHDTIQRTMNGIYSEHQGLKTMLYFMFQPLVEHFKSQPIGAMGSYLAGAINRGVFGGQSFFQNWQDRVTSRFGANESFRSKAHGGLDIDGDQGDFVEALADGIISFIKMDDGGPLDEDGRANTRAGGTEVGIRMPDGRTYFYSHLSAVNPNLKVGDRVRTGDWIGNVGGDPGVPGSGSSTTGSHLHLGYLDAQGNRLDPEILLHNLGPARRDMGDSSLGRSRSTPSTPQQVTVKVDLAPEASRFMSQLQIEEFRRIARQVMEEAARMRLQVNPTSMGWN